VDFARFRKVVGANARKGRWLKGLNQIDAAMDVVTPRLLAALEHGNGNPTLQTLWLLARRLGVSVKDLVETGEEPQREKPLRFSNAEQPKRGRKPKPRRLAKKAAR